MIQSDFSNMPPKLRRASPIVETHWQGNDCCERNDSGTSSDSLSPMGSTEAGSSSKLATSYALRTHFILISTNAIWWTEIDGIIWLTILETRILPLCPRQVIETQQTLVNPTYTSSLLYAISFFFYLLNYSPFQSICRMGVCGVISDIFLLWLIDQ